MERLVLGFTDADADAPQLDEAPSARPWQKFPAPEARPHPRQP
jgi:hypothetical protein